MSSTADQYEKRVYTVLLLRTLYITTFTVLAFCSCLKAQLLVHKQYTSFDGLPNSCIYRLYMDNNGILWMTTNYGISKFDGHRFTNIFPKQLKAATFAIAADNENTIWTGDIMNNFFSIKNDTTHCFTVKNKVRLFPEHAATDSNGIIWITFSDKNVGYISNNSIKRISINSVEARRKFNNVYTDRNGRVCFATSDGVFIADRSGRMTQLTTYLSSPIFSIFQKEDGTYYLGGIGKIYTYRSGNIDSIILPLKAPVQALAFTMNSELWMTFASLQGLYSLHNDKFHNYSKYINLDKVFVNDIYADSSDNLFIATHGRGLYIINSQKIFHFNESTGLTNNNVYCMATGSGGEIYAGSFGGLCILKNDSFHLLKRIPFRENEKISDLLIVGNVIWICTPFNIYKYHTITHELHKNSFGALSLCLNDNYIYAGSYGKVARFPISSDITNTPLFPLPSLGNNIVKKIVGAGNGSLWFATDKGALWQTKQGTFSYTNEGNLLSGDVSDIIIDSTGNTWFATASGLVVKRNNGKLEKYTTAEGLPANYCKCLAIHNKTLWIGTIRGLCSFDGRVFKQYPSGYGLPTEEIFYLHTNKKENSLWICTGNGVYKWQTGNSMNEINRLRIVITNLRVEDKNLYPGQKITLPWNSSSFSLSYVTPEYTSADKIIYEYRFANRDTVWHRTDGNSIVFNSLGSGNYKLQIRAKNLQNNFVSPPKSIYIDVLKPFWKQWWFILIVSLVVTAMVINIVYLRVRFIKKREQKKTRRFVRLLQLKLQATTALMSPHFIFNSLNSIQYYINISDKLQANRFLSKFAKLVRKTMENATRTTTSLSDEIHILENYLSLEKLRLGDKLSYNITIGPSLNPAVIKIPSLLLQPYIENAVKHGIVPKNGHGRVDVRICITADKYLEIEIEDNGVGIKSGTYYNANELEEYKQHSMHVNSQRLYLIEKLTNKKAYVSAKPVITNKRISGTLITITLPLTQASLKHVNQAVSTNLYE